MGESGAVRRLEVIGLAVEGEVEAGAHLGELVLRSLDAQGQRLEADDVLVVTQKIVSKAEGRVVPLASVEPSALAEHLAANYGKDPRQVELVLRESRRIVKMDKGLLITETHHGLVCANAGVDASNVSGGDSVALLPVDPDASAARLRDELRAQLGFAPAVIITDTFGRPWRTGLTNMAIGVAGMAPLTSCVGQRDRFGYELRVTSMAVADELAAAAELVMGKTDGIPLALIRGCRYQPAEGSAHELIREAASDLFR